MASSVIPFRKAVDAPSSIGQMPPQYDPDGLRDSGKMIAIIFRGSSQAIFYCQKKLDRKENRRPSPFFC